MATPKERRARDLAQDNPSLIDVGERVRDIRSKTITGTVEAVETGDRVPVLVVRTHRDGYLVRYNYDQVERDA